MTRVKRNLLAATGFVILVVITGCFDPVIAIDLTAFCLFAALFLAQVERWWKEPSSIWRRILATCLGIILLLPLMFFFYMQVPLICKLIAANGSSSRASNRLYDIAVALHQYHQKHQQFPPVALRSSSGQPLLSWRVQLLPYLGQEELYRQFHLDEPWNSPHNLMLLPRIPECYRLPVYGQQAENGGTFYQLIVGPGAVFEVDQQATLPELEAKGRLDSTIIMGIAQEPVPWTKPDDLVFEDGKPLALGRVVRRPPTLLGVFLEGEPGEGNRAYHLSFADGHCGSVYSKRAHSRLEPFVKWKGPKPEEVDDLR